MKSIDDIVYSSQRCEAASIFEAEMSLRLILNIRYGKQIQDKISELWSPKIDGDEKIDAFSMFEGANFKLIVGRKDKYPTYESSKFDNSSPVGKTDKEMEEVFNKLRPLQPLVAPEVFKSYDELKRRFDKVMGFHNSSGSKFPSSSQKSSSNETKERDLPSKESDDELSSEIDDILKDLDESK